MECLLNREIAPHPQSSGNKEVILAAGVIGTPQILQRSGIGPKALLGKAGIKVKQGLPDEAETSKTIP